MNRSVVQTHIHERRVAGHGARATAAATAAAAGDGDVGHSGAGLWREDDALERGGGDAFTCSCCGARSAFRGHGQAEIGVAFSDAIFHRCAGAG